MINIGKWNELPKSYQSIIKSASEVANAWMMAKYDAQNPAALKRLVAGGAKLQPFSAAILDASYKAATEVYAETSAANADFKKIHDSYMAFRNDQYLWWQVAEYTFDTYMIRRARG
jgi:TRAP-type mannitol/chloroaromatic compound transport system substrate-binding protein